jgi:hypothetical protein
MEEIQRQSDHDSKNAKSQMHSRITGDFGESMLLYFLSKHFFEPVLVDHSGIDIIAYNKSNKRRIGISVKSRSRTLQRPKDGLLVSGDNYHKIIDSCNFFDSEPYMCFVFDVPTLETQGTIYMFLMPMKTILKYYPKYKDGKDFTFTIISNLESYYEDIDISKIKFNYNSENWK